MASDNQIPGISQKNFKKSYFYGTLSKNGEVVYYRDPERLKAIALSEEIRN